MSESETHRSDLPRGTRWFVLAFLGEFCRNIFKPVPKCQNCQKTPSNGNHRFFSAIMRVPKPCQNMPKHALPVACPAPSRRDDCTFPCLVSLAPRARTRSKSYARFSSAPGTAVCKCCDPILRVNLLHLLMRCLRTEDGRSRSVLTAPAPPRRRRYWFRCSHGVHLLASFLTICATPRALASFWQFCDNNAGRLPDRLHHDAPDRGLPSIAPGSISSRAGAGVASLANWHPVMAVGAQPPQTPRPLPVCKHYDN